MIRSRFFTGAAFFFSAAFAIAFGFFWHDKMSALRWIVRYEYWLHLTAVGLTVYAGVCLLRSGPRITFEKRLCRQWILPTVVILAVSVMLSQSQPKEFKIVMDEPVLMATALQMHEQRESKTSAKAYEINGNFEILNGYTDKRPTLFAFIISQLHSLTGYRATQGFWLNTFLAPLFLGLLYLSGHLLWRRWGGYMAVALFATVPLLAMNVCGSGFELLNLTLVLATGLAAYRHLRQPSAASANLVVMFGVLLAHMRYESALFVGAVGLVIAAVWWRQRQVQVSWAMVVAPLLLVSIPLRRIIHADNDLLWQLDSKGATRPFSFEFFTDNLSHAFNFFFAYDVGQPNSLLLSVLFTMSLLCLVGLLLSRKLRIDPRSSRTIASVAIGAVILFNFGLLMCYFWGQIDDIMATRIALPFILFQVLFVTWVCSQYEWIRRRAPILLVAVVLYFATVTRPLMAQSNFLARGVSQQQMQWTFDYIAAQPEGPILFISPRHMAALIQRRSALVPKTAIRTKLRIHLHHKLHTFTDILFIEFLPYDSSSLETDKRFAEEVAKHFETETLVREKLNNHGEMRVSRLLSVKMDEPFREHVLFETKNMFDGSDDLKDFYRTLP